MLGDFWAAPSAGTRQSEPDQESPTTVVTSQTCDSRSWLIFHHLKHDFQQVKSVYKSETTANQSAGYPEDERNINKQGMTQYGLFMLPTCFKPVFYKIFFILLMLCFRTNHTA